MNADWLAQLDADRAPPPVGWWPLAPGWWGLIALLLLALLAAWWAHRRWRSLPQRQRRLAVRALQRLQDSAPPDTELARQVQDLLRRYALARQGRAEVAALSGEAWLRFVVQHGGQAWAGDTGQRLLRCAYGDRQVQVSADDRARWLQGAQAFVRGLP